MKKRWLVSSIVFIFVGGFFIVAGINSILRPIRGLEENCWNYAFGFQNLPEYEPCSGTFDILILGIVIFAVGVLLIVIPNIKKIKN